MVDRGADLSPFSQYPHEREICFAPLTGIEVSSTRVEDSGLIVKARLTVNLTALTIEQVIAKRHKVMKEMCNNVSIEIKNAMLHSETWQFCGWGISDELGSLLHKSATALYSERLQEI